MENVSIETINEKIDEVSKEKDLNEQRKSNLKHFIMRCVDDYNLDGNDYDEDDMQHSIEFFFETGEVRYYS